MLISGGNNLSKLKSRLIAAPNFLLSVDEEKAIFVKQREVLDANWDSVCEQANLNEIDRKLF